MSDTSVENSTNPSYTIDEGELVEVNSYDTQDSPALDTLKKLMNGEQAEEENEEESPEEQKEEEPKKEEKKEEDLFSRKFAAISRKEKQLRQREQEINNKLKELEARLESQNKPTEQKEEEVKESIESRLRKDPLNALKDLGFDLNTLGKIALQDGKLPIEMQMQLMREELKNEMMSEQQKLKEEIEAQKREKLEREEAEAKARDEKIIQDYKADIESFVNENADKYELISLTESEDLVYNVINEEFQKSETILTFDEACDMVEAYLEEDAKKVFEKSKKFQSSNPASKTSQKPPEPNVMSGANNPTTLTNDASTSVPSDGKKFLSEEDSKREAAKLIRWTE